MSANELRDEVLSADFPEYRKAIFVEAARFIHSHTLGQANMQYASGAMDAIRAIINIPAKVARTEEQREIIRKRIAEDFAVFEAEYLRKALIDE